jgi:hypothetical protein
MIVQIIVVIVAYFLLALIIRYSLLSIILH